MNTPNPQTAAETVNTAWIATARPIIQAMFAVDDAIYPLILARLADPLGYVNYAKMSPAGHAYEEAQAVVNKAVSSLMSILEGIRDNALCDAYVSAGHDDGPGLEEADEWNDDLAWAVMSVDAVVKMVGDEQ